MSKLIRFFDRQWSEKECIYETEDRSIRPDAECECEDCNSREARAFQQHSNCIAQII